jgi:hypothetical protein
MTQATHFTYEVGVGVLILNSVLVRERPGCELVLVLGGGRLLLGGGGGGGVVGSRLVRRRVIWCRVVGIGGRSHAQKHCNNRKAIHVDDLYVHECTDN